MTTRADALILPADTPLTSAELKKNLLFFDSVTLANPTDAALINDGDVVEQFPMGKFTWAPRNNFPRSADYTDEIAYLLSETRDLQSRGLVRVSPLAPLPILDPGVSHSLWHSAITNKALVEAAAPDRHSQPKPPFGIAGYMRGGVIAQHGYRSKYEITESRPTVELSEVDEHWTLYAHLRLGRALKFLRLSHALSLVPLALDRPNQEILMATTRIEVASDEQTDMPQAPIRDPGQFDFEIFDTGELTKALDGMSWRDVTRLRREILPGMNALREHIEKAVRRMNVTDHPNAYAEKFGAMQKEFLVAKEMVAIEWEKLRIASITKFGGVVGLEALADMGGLVGTVVGVPWADLLVKVFASGLVATAGVSGELKTLIPAKRAVKHHPLYFTDKLQISK